MADILIKNGLVFDGSGKQGEQKDILISGDKISAFNAKIKKRATIVIDANGSYVCPGFVDINNTSDHYLTIFSEPEQLSLLKQGITTILFGNRGSSLAPLVGGDLNGIRKWVNPYQININWNSFGEFLDYLSQLKFGVNVAGLVGYSTIRRGILGNQFRDLTEKELLQAKYLMEQSLSQGAFGISTDLESSHLRGIPHYEIKGIFNLLKKYRALYSAYLPSWENKVSRALAALEDLADDLDSLPKIEINHFRISRGAEDDLNFSLRILENLKNKGVDISFDLHPYSFSVEPLYLCLPDFVIRGSLEEMVKNIQNKIIRKKVIEELGNKKYDYSKIIISDISNFSGLIGKSIQELAINRGLENEEMLLEILKLANGRVIVLNGNLSDIGVESLVGNDLSIIATNSPGRNFGYQQRFLPYFKSYGTMPKFLSLVRKYGFISWPQAIYKLTYFPASKIGLRNRGLIKNGYFADLVIFNPQKIDSEASLKNPQVEPVGIEAVILNGKVVVNNSQFNGILAGKIFKR